MQALYFDRREFSVRELERPVPGPGEALVKVSVAGICRTDIEMAKGYMDFKGVPGHEFVGVVEECEDKALQGRRVVGEINISCGECAFCRAGLSRHCPNRDVLGIQNKNGAFAEYLTLPVSNLHQAPETLDDETAVFTEPVAACFEILEQVEVAGRRTAVLGDGKLGILAARVLAIAGPAELVVAGKHPEKLGLLNKDKIKTLLLPEFLSRAADPEKKYDMVVDAAGRADGFRAAKNAVRPRGKIVMKTTTAGRQEVDMARVVVDEVTVVGSRCGPFEPALKALSQGSVRVDDLVAGRYPLSNGVEAMSAASERGALKVLLIPGK